MMLNTGLSADCTKLDIDPEMRLLLQTRSASGGNMMATIICPDHRPQMSGKTVGPKVYFACGISGAVQHLAGMSSSDTIIAINKNPDFPIFKVATFGIVGDLLEVLPALTSEFKRRLG